MNRLVPLAVVALVAGLSAGEARTQGTSAAELTRQGDQLVRAGHLEQALRSYRQAVAADFTYTGAYDALCRVLFRLQRYEEAVRILRIAIRDNPGYAAGWGSLAYGLRQRGQGSEAIDAYNKALQLRPEDPDLYYGLGLAYASLGQSASALLALREYVRREQRPTRQDWVRAARAEIVKLGGAPAAKPPQEPLREPPQEPPQARAVLPNVETIEAIETAPDVIVSPPMPAMPAAPEGPQADRLRAQGDTLARAGKLPQALQAYEQAVRLDPFNLMAYDGLAYCAFRLGLYRQGAARLSVALRDNREYLRGWLHQARLLRAGGERAEAVAAYRRFLKERGDEAGVQLELARTLRGLGMTTLAVEAYQAALRCAKAPSEEAVRAAAITELRLLGAVVPTE